MRYAALFLFLLCLGCGPRRIPSKDPTPTPKPVASPLPFTGHVAQSDNVFSDGKGRRLLWLSGGQFSLSPTGDQAELTGTHAVVYRDGKPALTLNAKVIRVPKTADKLTAEGSVSAQTVDGRTVRCQTLTWLPGALLQESMKAKKNDLRSGFGKLSGRGNVVFLSGSAFALYGSRFTADTLLQTLKISP